MAADQSEYPAVVVDHFERPRNAGRLAAAPDVIMASAGSIAHGTRFQLSARVQGNALSSVHFAVYGCPHCIAAGSWLTERLQGASRPSLEAWHWREVADALQIPAEKRGHLLILEDAVRRLAESWPPQ